MSLIFLFLIIYSRIVFGKTFSESCISSSSSSSTSSSDWFLFGAWVLLSKTEDTPVFFDLGLCKLLLSLLLLLFESESLYSTSISSSSANVCFVICCFNKMGSITGRGVVVSFVLFVVFSSCNLLKILFK